MSTSPVVRYPPEFFRRVLRQEAPGGPPQSVTLVQPSVLAVDEPGALKVALLDADGYPSLEYQGEVTLEGLPGGTCALAFQRGEPAVGRVENISLP